MIINKRISIEKIPHNFVILKKEKAGKKLDGKKAKSKYKFSKKYYGSLKTALLSLPNEDVDTKDVQSILKSIKRLEKQIERSVNEKNIKALLDNII